MIISKDLISEELLTTFTVLNIRYEPHAESEWTLQFEDYPPIIFFDKYFQTQEEDQKLIGQKIKAQIHLDIYNDYDIVLVKDPKEQKKTIIDVPNTILASEYIPVGPIIVTGVYQDDIQDINYQDLGAVLDSIFKLKITEDLGSKQLGFKKGDWVKVKAYEHCIDIVRDYMPFEEENSIKI